MNMQIYYHFLPSKYATEDLRKGRVKISLINELNDPFELLPYLRYNMSQKRSQYHKIRSAVSKKYGLLCFCKTWGEPLLWGHYADKHKGIAIGFEILKDEVLEVKYTDKRRRFELTNSQRKNEKLFLDLAKAKYEKWSYEEESRIIVELEDCNLEKKLCFLPFKTRLKVKEIILGCKFDKTEIENIRGLANELNVRVILARQGWGNYKILKDGTKTSNFEAKKGR